MYVMSCLGQDIMYMNPHPVMSVDGDITKL